MSQIRRRLLLFSGLFYITFETLSRHRMISLLTIGNLCRLINDAG